MNHATLLLSGVSCVALLYTLYASQQFAVLIARNFLKNMYPKKHISKLMLVLSVLTLLESCHSSVAENEKKPVEEKVARAEIFTAQKGKLSSSLKLPGELIAFQQVDIYAKVNSFVKKLYADVGSEVKAGQLLAVMEAPELNSQLAGADSRLKSMEALYIASKASYDRLLETSKTPGTISPNDLDIALAKQKSDYAQLESARAAHKEIADNRNYLEIRAPFTGVVSARNVSAGAYVGPSGKGSEMPLFTLQEQKKLRLTVAIPEAYTGYLSNDSEVSFTVKSFPDKRFTARVKRLAGALDNRLRSERVEMDVINSDKRLLPGMVAEISIPLPAKDSAFVVPKTAVVNATENVFIVKVKEGRALRITVQKGREADDKVEVYGNIATGDTLLKSANEEIRDNAPVH